MTQDKSLQDEPQVLLGHLEFWGFVATGIFSERIVRKACCQLWVSREFLLFGPIFRPSGLAFLDLIFFRGYFSRDLIGNASKDGRLLGQGGQGCGLGRATIKKACVERFSFRTPTHRGNLKQS